MFDQRSLSAGASGFVCRRARLLAFLLLLGPQVALAAQELVTAAEARRAFEDELLGIGMPVEPGTRDPARPGPVIKVISPDASAPASTQVRFEIRFEPSEGSRIDLGSLRVLYGVLRVDVTERLRAYASINERGLVAESSTVPEGRHRFLIRIADDRGRIGEQEVRFRVGK